MAITRAQMAADRDAFDEEFDQERAAPQEPSEDEVFGLVDEEPEGAAKTQAGNAGASSPSPAKTSSTPPPKGQDAATQSTAQAQSLQAWEQKLQQRQAELDARAAAMATSNVNQQQTSSEGSPGSAQNDEKAEDGADPAIQLAEDFGQDFVDLVKRLVARQCQASMQDCMGDVAQKVDQLITELTQDKQQNHFKAIAAAHEDFIDVVDSPEFSTWQAQQAEVDQPEIARVIESGSAQEIIDLLTRFKHSQTQAQTQTSPAKSPSTGHQAHGDLDEDLDDLDDLDKLGDTDNEANDAALDAAEGVRSGGGLKLPKAPPASDDYAAAWDEF